MLRFVHPSVALATLSTLVAAQTPEETFVTATKSALDPLAVPYSTSVVTSEELARRLPRTLPEALSFLPGVSVQATGYGQGSPYLRGFTGYSTLLLVDGIRLNNSVFRSGPNQYWATVDPLALERLEVVRGPSSVLYGSDALGGTLNAFTRSPYTYGEGFRYGGSALYRYASADSSDVGRLELASSFGRTTGILVGADRKLYDDLEAGGDTDTQRNTGYDEWAGDAKLEHFLDEKTRLVLAAQRFQQFDAPRTHRTLFAESFEGTTVGTDRRHDFDQSRTLSYLQLHAEDQGGALDSLHASLSWQEQSETLSRVTGGGSASNQGFDVGTLGFFAFAGSETASGAWTYGIDYYRDHVDSFSSSSTIQGPVADDATYDLFGAFVQDELELGEQTTVTLGGRFNRAEVDAESVLDPLTSTQTTVADDWSAFVGSVRFLHRLKDEAVHLFGGVSQGFRAPNLSDLTRLDSARSGEFEIPSPGLDPEYTTQYELGLKTRNPRVSSQLAVFYTVLDDLILRRPTGNVNGSGQSEVVKENVGDGYVYGLEAEGALALGGDWELFSGATFTEGKVHTFPTSAPVTDEEYLDKLMPFMAQLGTRWERDGRWFEFVVQGAGDADRLSTADTLDTQRIPPGGTPGYIVLNTRGGFRIGRYAALQLGLENLLDEDYRVHGSGLNMPGRSLLVGLSLTR